MNLKGLTQLQDLKLDETKVSDIGLVHLKGLIRLQWLDLRFTKVSDVGARDLQKSLPNCKIRH